MLSIMKRKLFATVASIMWSVGLLGSSGAQATSCGTVANPTACSLALGQILFDFSSFSFLNSSSTGSAFNYTAPDITIDLSAAGGAPVITFAKDPALPVPGYSVFFANANSIASFTFSYDLTATPLSAGTIAFQSLDVALTQSTANNGLAQHQSIVSGFGNCAVFTGAPTKTCALSGSGPLSMGSIVTMAGNNGNASILNFSNKLNAVFNAASGSVPESTTWAMMIFGFGLVGAGLRRQPARSAGVLVPRC